MSTAGVSFNRITLLAAFLLCCFGASVVPASGPPAKMARTSIGGIEYVRLDHWAKARNFQFRWTVLRKETKVTSTWSALTFAVDSRRCVLNGVVVWLSYPVALQNGAAWIASADLATAVNPVLFPSRNAAGRKIRTICIDPGHGGKDPGNRDGRQQEKTYTLSLARELARQLSAAGFKVTQTRSGDSFVDLDARPELARRRGADLFLSLHFNSAGAGGRSVQGAEVYCLTPARASSTNARGEGAGTGAFPGNQHNSKNMLLSYHVQKALVHRLGVQDRGVKRARFAVLRPAAMPTVLIEGGFMTNPTEARRIYDVGYRRKMAAAIVEGVLAYRKAVEP